MVWRVVYSWYVCWRRLLLLLEIVLRMNCCVRGPMIHSMRSLSVICWHYLASTHISINVCMTQTEDGMMSLFLICVLNKCTAFGRNCPQNRVLRARPDDSLYRGHFLSFVGIKTYIYKCSIHSIRCIFVICVLTKCTAFGRNCPQNHLPYRCEYQLLNRWFTIWGHFLSFVDIAWHQHIYI
jgi:hypothetical protein